MGHSNHVNEAGEPIPSVSQIPGMFANDMSGFEDWICKGLHGKEDLCCTKAKRDYYAEAANLGNDVHELREAYLNHRPFTDGVPEYTAQVFEPVAKFYKDSGYKPLFVEEQMTGASFGGTLDGAGTFDVEFWKAQRKTFWANLPPDDGNGMPTTKSVWIEDLKIKSKIDKLHPLQLYGYRLLLQETKGITADWGLIIRREKKLDKSPEIQLKGYYLPAYAEVWEAAMKCWQFING